MPIPAQDVAVRTVREREHSPAEIEALLNPSLEVLQERLRAIPALVDRWFGTLPRVAGPAVRVESTVLRDRSFPGEIRAGEITLRSGERAAAEIVYLRGSPEAWLVRTVEDIPGTARYKTYSWYGMHDPSRQQLTASGEILAAPEVKLRAAQDLCATIDHCQAAVEEIDLQRRMTATPVFLNPAILDYLTEHATDLRSGVASTIRKLPVQAYRAELQGDSQLFLGAKGPFDRRDLRFFDAGALVVDAVREACLELMQLHDILVLHGAKPVLTAQLPPGGAEGIPYFILSLDTAQAMRLVGFAGQ